MSNERYRTGAPGGRPVRQTASADRNVRGASTGERKGTQAPKKKKKKKNQTKRIISLVLIAVALLLIVILLLKLASGLIKGGKEADVTTFTLKEDGKVVYEEVVDMSGVDVDEKELSAYANEELDNYNKAHGSDSVKLSKIRLDDGIAYQKTTYKDVTCYHDFTGYEVYNGSVSSAKSSGYDFETTFVSAYEGITGDEVNADAATNNSDLSVLIIRENGQVKVPGSIRFISANGVKLIDENTAEVYPADDGSDAAVLAYIIYEEK